MKKSKVEFLEEFFDKKGARKMKESTSLILENFLKEREDFIPLKDKIIEAITTLASCIRNGGKILVCGNGGSAADSEHIAGELLKSFLLKRPIADDSRKKLVDMYGEDGEFLAKGMQGGIKCIPLTSFCAYNTAFLNDCNDSLLFAQLVNTLGDKGDVLIGISTSGNSKNVCFAEQVAKSKGMKVLSLTGASGGKMKEFSDILLNVHSSVVYKIQELHLPIYHQLCLCLESEIFDS